MGEAAGRFCTLRVLHHLLLVRGRDHLPLHVPGCAQDILLLLLLRMLQEGRFEKGGYQRREEDPQPAKGGGKEGRQEGLGVLACQVLVAVARSAVVAKLLLLSWTWWGGCIRSGHC